MNEIIKIIIIIEVFSSYKSHPTLKAMIGMAPHGAVTFVSGLYAGKLIYYLCTPKV